MEDRKQPVKEQILHLLKMQGEQTAATLAAQLRVSPMAIRQHLQSLKAEQWVTYREERRPMGRPVKLWHLTDSSSEHFPDRHADLMAELLRTISTVFGDEGLDRLMTERSQRQIQLYQTNVNQVALDASWQQRVHALAALRSQEGYMADVVEQANGSLLLVENHCPICVAAQTCPMLCRAELEVFQAVLGAQVTVERAEHMLQGDRRCAYRIVANQSGD